MKGSSGFFQIVTLVIGSIGVLVVLIILLSSVIIQPSLLRFASVDEAPKAEEEQQWLAPDSTLIPTTLEGDLIRYGRELVAHTSRYLGPKGTVTPLTNGMNCQNCHLKAGKKRFGNNYSAVASTYPKFRARSGEVESIEKRINDCMERSLNGIALDTTSREMQALVSYVRWVGKDVPKGESPSGSGILDLPLLSRAADPAKGKMIFDTQCLRCHGQSGNGTMHEDGLEWKYPPLWGANSYNMGAGLFRISRLAGYVKANMPNDLAVGSPGLTDEEAWDVAGFILSMPRPARDISKDWPDLSKKPFDHPYGPYTDKFSETQHKFGPFTPIVEAQKK